MATQKNTVQLVWGIALTLMGVGVFFRVPQVMPKLQQLYHLSSALIYIRFCFYLIGMILIVGGIKKIHGHFRAMDDERE